MANIVAATILARVQARLKDSTDLAYDSAELAIWFQEGLEIIATTAECFVKTSDQLIALNNVVTKAADTISILAVRRSAGAVTWLDPSKPHEMSQWNEQTELPTRYCVMGDVIYINAAAGKVKSVHTCFPGAYTTVDDKYQPALIAYAEYRARASDRDTTLAARAWAEFENQRIAFANITNKEMLARGGS